MLLLPMIAAAGTAMPIASENAADLRCLAVYTLVGARATTAEDKAGVSGGVMYFIGRIDARTSGYDYTGNLIRLLSDKAFLTVELPSEGKRCGGLMVDKGAQVQAIGQALQEAGRKQGG